MSYDIEAKLDEMSLELSDTHNITLFDACAEYYGLGLPTPEPKRQPNWEYQRGINAAVLWLVANYADYKPEYLAETMLKEMTND